MNASQTFLRSTFVAWGKERSFFIVTLGPMRLFPGKRYVLISSEPCDERRKSSFHYYSNVIHIYIIICLSDYLCRGVLHTVELRSDKGLGQRWRPNYQYSRLSLIQIHTYSNSPLRTPHPISAPHPLSNVRTSPSSSTILASYMLRMLASYCSVTARDIAAPILTDVSGGSRVVAPVPTAKPTACHAGRRRLGRARRCTIASSSCIMWYIQRGFIVGQGPNMAGKMLSWSKRVSFINKRTVWLLLGDSGGTRLLPNAWRVFPSSSSSLRELGGSTQLYPPLPLVLWLCLRRLGYCS